MLIESRRKASYFKILRIDRYILSEVVGIFAGVCIFILFILLMFQALRLAEFFILHGVSAAILAKLSLFMSLSCLPIALPLAFLISILIGFSRLSSDSELVALKACGCSLLRMSVPILLFGFVVITFSIFLNMDWVPWGEISFKRTQTRLGNTKAVTLLKEGTFTSGFFDLLIFADKVDAKESRLEKVFIYDEREPKNAMIYVAQSAEIVPVKTNTEFGAAIMLHLYDGSMHHTSIETHTYEKVDFQAYHLYLKIDEGADTMLMKPHMIPQQTLTENIAKTDLSTYEGREYRGEYWRRYATAWSPLLFVFLGIGFGTVRYRTARTGAILTGFVILILYWTVQTIGTAALLRGTLSPFIAMQIPNAIIFILAVFGFRRAMW